MIYYRQVMRRGKGLWRRKESIDMSKKKIAVTVLGIILFLAVVTTIAGSVYIVNENEYKLTVRFGKVTGVVSEAGVAWKVPFLETVNTLPKERQLYDLAASDVITSDKKSMVVDSFVIWRISDPLLFAQTLNYSMTNAEYRLDTIVYNATKNVISATKQDDVISGKDGRLAQSIRNAIGSTTSQYGIEIVTFETKLLDLPDTNKTAVYERMISDREAIAADYTAQGAEKAQYITNETDRVSQITLSNARAQAAKIEAEGEQKYMSILASAYKISSAESIVIALGYAADRSSFNSRLAEIGLPYLKDSLAFQEEVKMTAERYGEDAEGLVTALESLAEQYCDNQMSQNVSEQELVSGTEEYEAEEEAARAGLETYLEQVLSLAESMVADAASYEEACRQKEQDKLDFYEFNRALDMLKISMTGDKTIFLPEDSPIAELFMK